MVTVAGLTLYVCFRHPCHQTLSVFSEFDFKYISSFIPTKIIKNLVNLITIEKYALYLEATASHI